MNLFWLQLSHDLQVHEVKLPKGHRKRPHWTSQQSPGVPFVETVSSKCSILCFAHFRLFLSFVRINSLQQAVLQRPVGKTTFVNCSPVPFVVDRNNIHSNIILLMRIQSRNLNPHRGKHSPGIKWHFILIFSLGLHNIEAIQNCKRKKNPRVLPYVQASFFHIKQTVYVK